jgi:hypothetical protein
MIPFVWPDYSVRKYYADPLVLGHRVILRNGAVLEGTRDFKAFSKEPPICTDVTPAKLCSWYREFTNHALSCGYFVMPYELLARGHGHSNGFAFDIDLPIDKTPDYSPWQNDIGRLLRKPGTFPRDSELALRAQSATNGYHAILAILSDTHPSFVDQPITLAMNWPRQRENQTIFDFHTDFLDYIRLRAIFMGGSADMTTSTIVDCFIHNCRHSNYLIQVSRFDRQDPQKNMQFQPSTLAITLNTYLSNPDSPTKRIKPPYVPHKPPYTPHGEKKPYKPNNPYQHKRINQVQVNLPPDSSSPPADDSLPDLDAYCNYIVAQIHTTPDLNVNPCLLCCEPHLFNACPLLRDEEFKSTFIIKLLACVSRELRNGKNRTGTNETAKRISQVLAGVANTPPDDNDDATSDHDPSLFR